MKNVIISSVDTMLRPEDKLQNISLNRTNADSIMIILNKLAKGQIIYQNLPTGKESFSVDDLLELITEIKSVPANFITTELSKIKNNPDKDSARKDFVHLVLTGSQKLSHKKSVPGYSYESIDAKIESKDTHATKSEKYADQYNLLSQDDRKIFLTSMRELIDKSHQFLTAFKEKPENKDKPLEGNYKKLDSCLRSIAQYKQLDGIAGKVLNLLTEAISKEPTWEGLNQQLQDTTRLLDIADIPLVQEVPQRTYLSQASEEIKQMAMNNLQISNRVSNFNSNRNEFLGWFYLDDNGKRIGYHAYDKLTGQQNDVGQKITCEYKSWAANHDTKLEPFQTRVCG